MLQKESAGQVYSRLHYEVPAHTSGRYLQSPDSQLLVCFDIQEREKNSSHLS